MEFDEKSAEAERGLVGGLFLNRSFRASVPDAAFDPAANLTLTFGREGAEMERRDCLETFEVVRLRNMTGAEEPAMSGVFGRLAEFEICVSGEGVLGLPSASPMDVYPEPYDDGPATDGHSELL